MWGNFYYCILGQGERGLGREGNFRGMVGEGCFFNRGGQSIFIFIFFYFRVIRGEKVGHRWKF